jgi:hypothetical protein
MKQNIKFENWKNGRQIVIRNEKGQLISRTKQKGSQIKTKAQAVKKYKEDGTLSRFIKVLSKQNPQIKKAKNLTFKGTNGTINIKNAKRAQLIGKNTAVIKTAKPLKNYPNYQWTVLVKWGDKQQQTIGRSDFVTKKGSKLQAFQRAVGQAVELKILDYTYKFDFTSETEGIATSSNGKDILLFTMSYEVQTYVRTS